MHRISILYPTRSITHHLNTVSILKTLFILTVRSSNGNITNKLVPPSSQQWQYFLSTWCLTIHEKDYLKYWLGLFTVWYIPESSFSSYKQSFSSHHLTKFCHLEVNVALTVSWSVLVSWLTCHVFVTEIDVTVKAKIQGADLLASRIKKDVFEFRDRWPMTY
jgi:hypothetical protein